MKKLKYLLKLIITASIFILVFAQTALSQERYNQSNVIIITDTEELDRRGYESVPENDLLFEEESEPEEEFHEDFLRELEQEFYTDMIQRGLLPEDPTEVTDIVDDIEGDETEFRTVRVIERPVPIVVPPWDLPRILIGAKAGPTITSITDSNTDQKYNFCAGLQVQLFPTRIWGIETGFYYTQRGFYSTPSEDISYKIGEDYFKIPFYMVFRYYFPAIYMAPFIASGIDINLWMSSDIFIDGIAYDYPYMNRYYFSLPVVAGFAFNTPIGVFAVEFDYSLGLTESNTASTINDPSDPNPSTPNRIDINQDAKKNEMAVYISYQYDIGSLFLE